MILKRHKDFINESNSRELYGYIGKDELGSLKIGDEIIQYGKWSGDDIDPHGEKQTIIALYTDMFTTVDLTGISEDLIKKLNNDRTEEYAEHEEDIKDTYFKDMGKDEYGFFFVDTWTGSRMYYKYLDNSKNKQYNIDAAKFGIVENLYDDKNSGKVTDLSFLLKQLKELIDGNDSYKANVRKEDDKIVVDHEVDAKKQQMIIKDNGQENDFFLLSGTEADGKTMDDMGEQPSETIFVKISKMFQEII